MIYWIEPLLLYKRERVTIKSPRSLHQHQLLPLLRSGADKPDRPLIVTMLRGPVVHRSHQYGASRPQTLTTTPSMSTLNPIVEITGLSFVQVRCWDKIQTIIKSEEGLGIEYDENVICDVCRSPDSEDGNEMVFCDACNICVHQACYGITVIPPGKNPIQGNKL